ncbi:MAG TPA: protein kinase, partial [Thermoanaerobaculia bacterium]|nr:protein kinase [Thermoanaerobaculia bacterium]
NITAVYDIGSDEAGEPYVVSELLEGETLRTALAAGKLSARRAIDYAIQIAHGLAAAHEKGIVHRDLKPENLFVTRDGRVKILDFGLAKLTHQEEGSQVTNLPTATAGTEPGVVLGTLGYMSPEQVRGRPADARSDIFSFGAILYEILSGNRAFRGDSAADTMSAILKEDPPEISLTNQSVSPGLERVTRHCLEKNPEQRFHSAHDLAFDLEALSGTSGTGVRAAASRPLLGTGTRLAMAAAAALILGLAAGHFLWTASAPATPSFRRLTFRRGNIGTARFAPDGQSIVYSAAWETSPIGIYSSRLDRPESLPLGFPKADLIGVSVTSELGLSLHDAMSPRDVGATGTLARATIGGGAPREVLEYVNRADWTADGRDFAIVRSVGGRERIECPIGKVLYASPDSAIVDIRVSRSGDRIAFVEASARGALVCVVDREGRRSVLTKRIAARHVCWSPDGREVWYDVRGDSGEGRIESVDLAGTTRPRVRVPAGLLIHDIARDGRLLVERYVGGNGLLASVPDAGSERQLAWFDRSHADDLSADGRLLLITEAGEATGAKEAVYIRKTDGSAAVRLGDGAALAFSADGKTVLARRIEEPGGLVLIPTGSGAPTVLPREPFSNVQGAALHPDGRRIVVVASLPGKGRRFYVRDLPSGPPRAISPEGFDTTGQPISADGKWVVGFRDWSENLFLFPIDGGEPREIPNSLRLDPVRWTSDGALFVSESGTLPKRVHRLDVSTGARTLFRELAPPEGENAISINNPAMTADGRYYAYSYSRAATSDLFLVEGLRAP